MKRKCGRFFRSKLPLRSMSGGLDVETVEVNVTNRPAKSNPVNMPASSSLIPVVIESSSGSMLILHLYKLHDKITC